jgi:hypothetical protein
VVFKLVVGGKSVNVKSRIASVIYISPTGDDAAAGNSPGNPRRSLQKAASAVGGCGTIVLLAGTYTGDTLDYSRLPNITVRAEGVVNVMLGEKVPPAAWTLHTGSIYKATVSTVIPNTGNSTQNKSFVFEWETPEVLGEGYTLEHFRLTQGASATSLNAGQWFYSAGTLYIRATDSANPATAGRDYWIPNRSGASFIKAASATGSEIITVDGVNVFFGDTNFQIQNASNFTVKNCLSYGAGAGGLDSNAGNTTGLEEDNRYAANGADGTAQTCNSGSLALTLRRVTSVGNGNQGQSAHGIGSIVTHDTTALAYNGTGGSFSVTDSTCGGNNVTTLGNLYCGVGAGIASTNHGSLGTWTNWTSTGDEYGVRYNGAATGTPTTYVIGAGCTISAPTSGFEFQTLATDDKISVAAGFIGGHDHDGPGAVTFL